jgi:hypothetical protein
MTERVTRSVSTLNARLEPRSACFYARRARLSPAISGCRMNRDIRYSGRFSSRNQKHHASILYVYASINCIPRECYRTSTNAIDCISTTIDTDRRLSTTYEYTTIYDFVRYRAAPCATVRTRSSRMVSSVNRQTASCVQDEPRWKQLHHRPGSSTSLRCLQSWRLATLRVPSTLSVLHPSTRGQA